MESTEVDSDAACSGRSEFWKKLCTSLQTGQCDRFQSLVEEHRERWDEASQGELRNVLLVIVSKNLRHVLQFVVPFSDNPSRIVQHACLRALHSDNFDFFQYVLKEFAHLASNGNAYADSENNLLHVATSLNRVVFAKHLLALGVDPNVPNVSGMTPLGVAVTKGHVEVTRLLIQAGALTCYPTNIHLLMLATHLGHADIVDVLLECGLGQTESNQFKQNALMVASKKGHAAIVNRLLDAGYNVECSDRFGYTPLMYAVVEGHIDVVRLLLERGCDPLSKRWSAKDTALHFAASYGHVEITALLLQYISDPDIPDCIGITPLYLAAEEGHLNVVEILAPKCDLYSMCGDKGRPLDAAVEYGHLHCLKYFLENGDTVMIKDNNGRTPLMKAACRGHVDMVKFLLDRASDISAEDDLGKTALSYAVLSMNPKCVEVLLSAGASVGIVDSDGVALLMVAIKVGQPAIVSLFILAGADLGRKWRVNRALDPLYPLELAVKQENFEVVQLLVNAGCTISMEDITNHWNRMEFESGVGYRLHPLPGQSGSTMSLTNDNEAVRSFLKKHATKPYPLKCHCRKAIWKSLPKPYWCSVGDLPLPNLMKDYLLMTESTSPALQK